MTHNVVAQLSVTLQAFKMVETRQMSAKIAARRVERINQLVPPVEGEKRPPQYHIFYSPLVNLVGLRQLVMLRPADADTEATSYGVIRYDVPVYLTMGVEDAATLLTTKSGEFRPSVTLEEALELIEKAASRLDLVHAS